MAPNRHRKGKSSTGGQPGGNASPNHQDGEPSSSNSAPQAAPANIDGQDGRQGDAASQRQDQKEVTEYSGTGKTTITAWGDFVKTLPKEEAEMYRDSPPEEVAQYEFNKRKDLETDFYRRMVDKDKKIDEQEQKITELDAKYKTARDASIEQERKRREVEARLNEVLDKLNKQEKLVQMHSASVKSDQETIKRKDKELQDMQKKKAEFFQDKKKALQELEVARATAQELHAEIDRLEQAGEEKDAQIEQEAFNGEMLLDVIDQLEGIFSLTRSEDLSVEEFMDKIRAKTQTGLQRMDSHASLKDKKPVRKSLGDELTGFSEGESEGEDAEQEDEGEKTLTLDTDVAELQRENADLKSDLDQEKKRVSQLNVELDAWRKVNDERNAQASNLGMSGITSTSIAPVSPTNTDRDRVATLEAELATLRAAEDSEKKAQQPAFGMSGIMSTSIAPVAPTQAKADRDERIAELREKLATERVKARARIQSAADEREEEQSRWKISRIMTTVNLPPAPPRSNVSAPQQTRTQTVYVTTAPSIREYWEQIPPWAFWLLAMLGLLLAWCIYAGWGAWQEYALWFGANDATSAAARTRRGVSRRQARAMGDGLFWAWRLAVQRWLGEPMPKLST